MLLPAVRTVRRSTAPAVLVAASAASCVLAAIGMIAALAARPAPQVCPAAVAPPAPAAIHIPAQPVGVRFAQQPPPIAFEPGIVWASEVRAMSSQYDAGAWSAAQALGAPDVYPGSGDDDRAWASLGADDRTEYLEVGFAPRRISALRIYETYNPGAVSRVELTFADGTTHVVAGVAPGGAGADAVLRRVDLGGCTTQPVIAARVTVDSTRVAGWNEIDAIGGEVCD